MIKVTKEDKGSIIAVKLSGSIDETVNFDQALGPLQGEIHINSEDNPGLPDHDRGIGRDDDRILTGGNFYEAGSCFFLR